MHMQYMRAVCSLLAACGIVVVCKGGCILELGTADNISEDRLYLLLKPVFLIMLKRLVLEIHTFARICTLDI